MSAINHIDGLREMERRMRRALLVTLSIAMESIGGLSGTTLRRQSSNLLACDERFRDDGHCLRLLRELAAKKLIEVEDRRSHVRDTAVALDNQFYSISEKGISLVNQTITPDPDVDDDRVE